MATKLRFRSSISILIFFFSIQIAAFGQSYQDFKSSDNLDEKCRIAEVLALDYVVTDLDSLRILGEQLLSFSNKKYSKKGINTSYFLIGNYLIRTAKEQKGLELLRQAKNYYLSIEDYDRTAEIYNEIGNAYGYLAKHKEACKWYEQSLMYGELATDEHITYMAQINLAQAQNSMGEYDLARENAEKYRDWVLKLGSLKASSNAFAVLGSIALNQEKHKQAIYYFEQCYKFAVKAGDNSGQGHAYTNIGIAKYLQGDIVESERYFKEAIEFRKNVQNVSLICDAYLNYGGILFEQSKNKEAIESYTEGLKIAQKNKKYLNEIELLGALKEAYAEFDLEKLGKINKLIEAAENNQAKLDQKHEKINGLLSEELRESDRIRKSGFISESERWPFYVGVSILFIGFFFLVARRKLH